jgi:hypothetical protein
VKCAVSFSLQFAESQSRIYRLLHGKLKLTLHFGRLLQSSLSSLLRLISKRYLWLLLLLAAPLLAPAQRRPATRAVRLHPRHVAPTPPKKVVADQTPAFLRYLHSGWVDSLMRVLTPRQRVAQLFMLAAYSNKPAIYQDSISTLIRASTACRNSLTR